MRRNIESKNVWQQILGRKNLGSKFFWMKIRGGNFASKIFGEFLASKMSFGEKKNTEKQKCFGGKIWGAKILRANCYLNGFSIELI